MTCRGDGYLCAVLKTLRPIAVRFIATSERALRLACRHPSAQRPRHRDQLIPVAVNPLLDQALGRGPRTAIVPSSLADHVSSLPVRLLAVPPAHNPAGMPWESSFGVHHFRTPASNPKTADVFSYGDNSPTWRAMNSDGEQSKSRRHHRQFARHVGGIVLSHRASPSSSCNTDPQCGHVTVTTGPLTNFTIAPRSPSAPPPPPPRGRAGARAAS